MISYFHPIYSGLPGRCECCGLRPATLLHPFYIPTDDKEVYNYLCKNARVISVFFLCRMCYEDFALLGKSPISPLWDRGNPPDIGMVSA